MHSIIKETRPAVTFILSLTLLFGFAYPALCTITLQAVFPAQSQGSLIKNEEGTVLGSALIGQPFSKPQYFWGRLSATAPYAYNAASSSGSNLSIANPTLLENANARISALHAAAASAAPIPVDLVTASGSGLDPHISPAAANYQAARVAHARGIPEAQVQTLVERYTESRQFGLLGEAGVNVLKLNLALDGKI